MFRPCRLYIIAALLIVIPFISSQALAQGHAAAPGAASSAPMGPATVATPAGPVLTAIPEQAALFVAVKNITDATSKVDTLLQDIGLGMMATEPLLMRIKQGGNFGPGFNDNGGFALIVLDPALLGYKPEDLVEEKEETAEKPAPLVYIVPCTDIKTIWLDATASEEDGLTKLEANGETVYGKLVGGYALLGEGPKPVKLALDSKRPVLAKLGKPQLALVNQSDVVAYADVKALQPWIKALAQKAQRDMDQMPKQMQMEGPFRMLQGMRGKSLNVWVRLAEQMDSLALGLNINKDALVINRYVSFSPQSDLAKVIAGTRFGSGPMLTQMPDLPYVLAVGTAEVTQLSPQAPAAAKAWMKDILDSLAGNGVSPEVKDRLSAISADWQSHVKSFRLFLGSSPKDSGVFGLAATFNCDKADALLQTLPEAVQLKQQVLDAMMASAKATSAPASGPAASAPAMVKPEMRVTLKYTPAALTVSEASVATLDVDVPQMAKMDPNEKADLAKVLGEDRIRFYIAKANDKTLVITLGGAQPFLTQAIAAARGGKDLAADPAVATSLKEMPKDLSSLGIISVPNLVQQIKEGLMAVQGPQAVQNSPLAAVEMKKSAPVAIGRSIVESGDMARVYIPTQMLNDLVRMFMTVAGGGPGPGGHGAPGQQDF
jgi:hypothetical protein